MSKRTPEGVIVTVLNNPERNNVVTAIRIMRELKKAGFEVIDMLGDEL